MTIYEREQSKKMAARLLMRLVDKYADAAVKAAKFEASHACDLLGELSSMWDEENDAYERLERYVGDCILRDIY